MNWFNKAAAKISNQPVRYDRARVDQLKPIRAEVEKLGLPLIRLRKLNGILGGLEMQIEDGGDSPEVNKLLLEALRAGILHQVDERQARAALQAIDTFAQAEAKRWAQVKAGTLPPPELDPDEKLDDLMQEGYTLIYDQHQLAAGCDRWLAAWELVKQLATPAMRTVTAFDRTYPLSQFVSNWASDMEMELGNASVDNARYHEHRLRFARESLAQFPDDDDLRYLNMRRAEGEALWHLGRQAEAETVYQALVKKLPDDAWAYIGWADNYYMWRDSGKDHPAAERILRQALERPAREDRQNVLERLIDLYEEWGQPDKQAPLLAELAKLKPKEIWSHAARSKLTSLPQPDTPSAPQVQKPKRNDPCWCGSGKKYKQCHLKTDRP
jgi:tetratricopeptide (TPR) repeat protein